MLQELARLRWDVIGIAKTHWCGIDDRMFQGCRILNSGRADMVHRSGVALILSRLAQQSARV